MIHSLIKPVLVLFFLSFVQLYAQSFTVSGTVLNKKGQPLIGANVFIDGTALGSATDIEGNYQIKKIPSGKKYTITAMFIGHRTMTKDIIDLRMVNIFIDLEDLDRANNILNNTFTAYQTNKLILQGDISAIEKKFDEAKQKYIDAVELSENETQKNLINLKISTLTD